MVEKGLGHLFITSNSSHFFNKTDFEQYLFQSKFDFHSNFDTWYEHVILFQILMPCWFELILSLSDE